MSDKGRSENYAISVYESKNEKTIFEQASRNINIDVLRGFAILIVVLGHSIQVNLLEEENVVWNIILKFQMPLMFVISGFSMGFSFPTSSGGHFEFIIKKAKRLLIPYLAWMVVHYILVSLLPTNHRQFGIATFISEIPYSDFWFLRELFIYMCFAWIVNEVLRKTNNGPKLGVLMLCIAAVPVYWVCKLNILANTFTLTYWMCFVLGYIIHQITLSKIYTIFRQNKWMCIILCNLLFVIVAIDCFFIAFSLKGIVLSSTLSLAIFGIFLFLPLKNNKIVKALSFIGKNTLGIYSIHWCLLFSPLWRINFYTSIFTEIPLFIKIVCTAVIWVLLCLCIIKLLSMRKYLQHLFLGKYC